MFKFKIAILWTPKLEVCFELLALLYYYLEQGIEHGRFAFFHSWVISSIFGRPPKMAKYGLKTGHMYGTQFCGPLNLKSASSFWIHYIIILLTGDRTWEICIFSLLGHLLDFWQTSKNGEL